MPCALGRWRSARASVARGRGAAGARAPPRPRPAAAPAPRPGRPPGAARARRGRTDQASPPPSAPSAIAGSTPARHSEDLPTPSRRPRGRRARCAGARRGRASPRRARRRAAVLRLEGLQAAVGVAVAGARRAVRLAQRLQRLAQRARPSGGRSGRVLAQAGVDERGEAPEPGVGDAARPADGARAPAARAAARPGRTPRKGARPVHSS